MAFGNAGLHMPRGVENGLGFLGEPHAPGVEPGGTAASEALGAAWEAAVAVASGAAASGAVALAAAAASVTAGAAVASGPSS